VRRGGGWKRGTVERPAGAPVLDPTCERLRVKFPGPTRQKAKYSRRANVVRCCPNNRHAATTAACPFGANFGSRDRSLDHSSARSVDNKDQRSAVNR
jgi:hypothetical protein